MSSHRTRGWIVALALTLAALVLGAAAAAAQTTIPDTTRYDNLLLVRIDPARPCIHDSIRVEIGDSCSPCLRLQSFTAYNNVSFALVLDALTRQQCEAETCHNQGARITLPPQPAGSGLVVVNIVVNVPPDSLHPAGSEVRFTRTVLYAVSDSCEVTPVPLPPVPWLIQHVTIAGGIAPCDTCAPVVCSGQPLEVRIDGALPDGCWGFDGIELAPMPALAGAVPTINVRLHHANDSLCTQTLSTFSGTVPLAARPAGRWPFLVQELVSDGAGQPIGGLAHRYSYVAKDSCGPPPPGCVWPYLDPVLTNREPATLCNLAIPPGGTGAIRFASHSFTALAGLQGTFESTPGLDIVGIRQVGPAAGMHLLVSPSGTGGRHFVLFADHGAPIPPGQGEGILEVTVHADPHLPPGAHAYLRGTTAAASDSNGTSIPVCAIETFAAVQATVCIRSAATCDVNGDGATNVADLVGMARCWYNPSTCPDSATMSPDCTHDGAFHLDDILCCARAILGGGSDDSTSHAAARLHVEFGTPLVAGNRVTVSLLVHGASEMNGALLRVRFPGDRYDLVAPGALPDRASAVPAGTRGAWMPLVEGGASDVVVGILRLDTIVPDEIEVPLVFTLKPGQSPGGALSIDESSVIAPDGSGLKVDLSQATTSLPAAGPGTVFSRIDLLVGPNPTSGLARFTVQLPAAGLVDLAIYDLAGRRIATPWHGVMDAGQRDVPWDGSTLRRGFYFARLRVNGEVRTRRVLLQPGS